MHQTYLELLCGLKGLAFLNGQPRSCGFLLHNYEIFRSAFVCIHYRLFKISSQIIE